MFVIGIAGGTGSGKSTLVKRILEYFSSHDIAVISQDSYYKDNRHIPSDQREELNFDHPDSIEFSLLESHILKLKRGESIDQPVYSFITCTRQSETIRIKPKKVIILEGILIFYYQPLRELMDIKIFLDADPDYRLARVIQRDLNERGRTLDKVLDRYEKTVKPMHIQFIEPTKQYADIIIPQGGNNKIAINMITTFIEKKYKL